MGPQAMGSSAVLVVPFRAMRNSSPKRNESALEPRTCGVVVAALAYLPTVMSPAPPTFAPPYTRAWEPIQARGAVP